jgi:hypothetical protein
MMLKIFLTVHFKGSQHDQGQKITLTNSVMVAKHVAILQSQLLRATGEAWLKTKRTFSRVQCQKSGNLPFM